MWLFEKIFFLLYQFIFWPLAIVVITFAKRFNPKLQKLYEQRRSSMRARHTTMSFLKSPVWIHAASGEFEYAKPVIRKIKELYPDQPVFVTYFSPSYVDSIQKTPGIDVSSPLPLDLPGPVRDFLNRLNPCALLIARTDVWPELITQVRDRKIPSLLFSTTTRQYSESTIKRYLSVRRRYQKWLYSKLTQVFVVSPVDNTNLCALGLKHVEVHGDTRFDQVVFRLEHPKKIKPIAHDERPILVAGSTWPEDEKELLPAVVTLLREKKLRLIIAPHELNHLDALSTPFKKSEIDFDIYSQLEIDWKSSVLVIDQIGILADLYTLGDLAFVGGSFRDKVHSVMEPLAAGLTTIVGPRHTNNREAIDFQQIRTALGSAVTVAHDSKEISRIIASTVAQKDKFEECRAKIRNEVQTRTGGTDAVMQWLGVQLKGENLKSRQ